MSTIKFCSKTVCIHLRHLASNARSLQENLAQSLQCLVTMLTLKRLLTCVYSLVYFQISCLYQCIVALLRLNWLLTSLKLFRYNVFVFSERVYVQRYQPWKILDLEIWRSLLYYYPNINNRAPPPPQSPQMDPVLKL